VYWEAEDGTYGCTYLNGDKVECTASGYCTWEFAGRPGPSRGPFMPPEGHVLTDAPAPPPPKAPPAPPIIVGTA
jgi:hypothetical protein